MKNCDFAIKDPMHDTEYLCMRYSCYTYNGRHWSNYPCCNEEICPFIHPEFLDEVVFSQEEEDKVRRICNDWKSRS